MKKLTTLCLAIATLSLMIYQNCGSGEEEKPNQAPSCSIASPSNNASFNIGATITISVSATDADGSITNVKINIDDVNVTTLQSSPYSYDWNTTGSSTGQHNIKATATDDGGLTKTAQIIVTVTANAPTVATAEVTNITASSATSGGNVTDDGGGSVTARGVVWAESSGPTLDSNLGKTSDGTGAGVFTSDITGLNAATMYYVRAYATNDGGTSYGDEKSFTTAGLPVVTTGSVSAITSVSATGSGEVTSDGGSAVTARGLVWGTMSMPTLEDNDSTVTSGSGTGAFTADMKNLTRFTDYAVRAYATNSAGTAYGDPVYFSTLPGPPVVTTAMPTNLLAFTVNVGGSLTDDGGANIVNVGVVMSTSPGVTIDNKEFGAGGQLDSNNDFLVLFSGLGQNTTYYARAYATNDYGTTYGEEFTFTTNYFSYTTGTFIDSRDNRQYATIDVYGQVWMAQNLAYLPSVCGPGATCGYWVYDYNGTDVTAAKVTTNYADYGVLYNWTTAKSACPTGWHLPTDDEWGLLELNTGMPENLVAGYNTQRVGTTFGNGFKETGSAHWTGVNDGTNMIGFNAVPGGEKTENDNIFQFLGFRAEFWTATSVGTGANEEVTFRDIEAALILKYRRILNNRGMSVRCVKD